MPHNKESTEYKRVLHGVISALSVGIVWVVVSLVFFLLKILPFNIPKTAVVFVLGIPVSCIVMLVFACIWYGNVLRCLCASGIIWGVFLVIRLLFGGSEINYLLITAGILQVMMILLFYMIHRIHLHKLEKRSASPSEEDCSLPAEPEE